MIRKITFLITLLCCVQIGYSQSVNLIDASINPAPLQSFQANGSGQASFRLQETSGTPVSSPVFGSLPNVVITVDLGDWIELPEGVTSLSTITIVDVASGDDRSSIFTTSYDEANRILKFKQTDEDIPLEANILFTFPIKVIQNSSETQANNGFNANIAALGSDTNAEGNAAFFTWTTNTTTAVNDINNTYVNLAVSGNVLTNDYDLEGDVQTVNTIPIISVNNGVLVLNTDGSYTYTPEDGFIGEDSFTYKVCDDVNPEVCDQGQVFIEVLPEGIAANETPIANADTAITEEGITLTGNVASNDYDPDRDPLTVETIPVTNVSNGELTLSSDGTFTYEPDTGFTGIDSFTYQICDDANPTPLCDAATVEIHVNSNMGNITVTNDDAFNTTPDVALAGVNLLENDFDPEGNTQSINTIPVIDVSNGTLTINSDGTFNYQPKPGFNGQDSFIYKVCDDGVQQACDEATAVITVGGLANTTVAVNDIGNTNEGTMLAGNVLTNDYDLEGDVQTFNTRPLTSVSNGVLVLSTDGSYTYTPENEFVGEDSFTYQVCDDGTPQACDKATVFIEVVPDRLPTNNAPIANPDTVTTEEGTTLTGNVATSNDYDPDGDPLTVNTIPVANVINGELTLSLDGTFTYEPAPGFTGIDSFTYKICDDADPTPLCDTATVEINVNSNMGNITVAKDDAFNTVADTANNNIVGNLLANDFDPEGNTQSINTIPVSNVSNGTLTINSDGTFNYQPTPGFNGQDSFTYKVCDDGAPQACDIAVVIILVQRFMAPDYTISVMTTETNIVGAQGDIDFVIFIGEGNGFDSNGLNNVEFRISHSQNFQFTYQDSLTELNGTTVFNADWRYVLEGGLHKFTYIGNGEIFAGRTFSRIGVKASFVSPDNSKGERPLKATIKGNSGGQVETGNDNDFDTIRYSNNSNN